MPNNLFAERLFILRKEYNLKREDVAKILNCSVSAVGNYENGNRTPDFDSLLILAKTFDTTTDYLLGLTDAITNNRNIQYICDYTGLSAEAVETLSAPQQLLKGKLKEDYNYLLSEDEINSCIKQINIMNNFLVRGGYGPSYHLEDLVSNLLRLENVLDDKIALLNRKIKALCSKSRDIINNELRYSNIEELEGDIEDRIALINFKLQEINKDFAKSYFTEKINEINCLQKQFDDLYQKYLNFDLPIGMPISRVGGKKNGNNSQA